MRVGIVNDVPFVAEVLRTVVDASPDHEVAWVAEDGVLAVEAVERDRPDIVLMDIVMPRMDGVEATRRIMQRAPCPILVVTASVDRASAEVFEALGAGAFDAVRTPSLAAGGSISGSEVLLEKMADLERRAGRGRAEPCAAVAGVPLVVLGSSTGGPEALRRILTAPELPRSAAYVAIQHLDGAFFGKLATWLDGEVPLEVCAVQRGVGPAAGRVLMPSSDTHLELGAAGGIVPARADCGSPYRPCIDVFFRSVAERWPGRVVGVLLTGMGRDGAEGLLELRRAGAHTIAQDPETCSAPGMPRAAIELGAVAEIAPIEGIGSAVGRALRRQPAQRQSTR